MPFNKDPRFQPAASSSGREPRRGPDPRPSSFWYSRTGLVAIGFLAIAAFLLFYEHRVHVFGYLPFLLLLLCPLLHIFMHGGHGHGEHGAHEGHGHETKPPQLSDAPKDRSQGA